MKPNFEEISRKELIAYVLAHREDEQAFGVLMNRRIEAINLGQRKEML
ncbi:MAG: hypothetical protein MUF49_16385 [Oculatellaceae cyanobacterium Prado106]|nr:hypothetical protein [Oculatellaceae cyanobacterium Prado106]